MNTVLHSFIYSLDFLEEQVADLTAQQMRAQPGGLLNHPAWTIGHLAYVLNLIGTVIGLEPSLSESWLKRYGPGSRPVTDPGQYEDAATALGTLRNGRDRIVEKISLLDDV